MSITRTTQQSNTLHKRTRSKTDHLPSPSNGTTASPEPGASRTQQTISTHQSILQTLTKLFHKLPAGTQKLLKRAVFSALLLSGFMYLIYGGPIPIIATMILAQYQCFSEVITIALTKYGVQNKPRFRHMSVYFLVAANFFFFGEHIAEHYLVYYNKFEVLRMLYNYHRFISFCGYFVGIIWFVLTLQKGYFRTQFALLAWTHLILLVIVGQAYLVVKSVFQGMIWFVISIATITCNDIMAFVFGRLFGKTPLISLSPKKTWEGFIGGGLSTILVGLGVAHWLCNYERFVCPMEYRNIDGDISMFTQCEPSPLFQATVYTASFPFLEQFQVRFTTFPFVFHTLWLSLFGSLVAPFGGFFASGFKRAFKVKDFGDTIPGHGGIMDRFDCQLIMLTFVHVYISSFIRSPSVEKMLEKVMYMETEQQVEFYNLLRDVLRNNGVVD